MRSIFPLALIISLIFSGSYLFYINNSVCNTPIHYRLGTIDDRFNLTDEEAKTNLAEVVSIWEEATNRDLFVYDKNSKLAVNFVYDDRQQRVETEASVRNSLDKKEQTSTQIATQYTELNNEYKKLRSAYDTRVTDYNARLKTFNDIVAKYNSEGGAPDSAFAELQKEESYLKTEAIAVSSLSEQLSKIVVILNTLGDQGNKIIEQYNAGVQSYNSEFGKVDEFTQGDYQGDKIDIYKFSNELELQRVLLHEFGHSLGIGHVEGSTSIMYYLLDSQPDTLELTSEDISAFTAVCGDAKGVRGWARNIINQVHNLISP
jgi:hypothetical protein